MRFVSLRGWPMTVASDPGSQLQKTSGNMVSWWEDLGMQMVTGADAQGFKWDIRPSNSPWRQGKSEVTIKVIKRLLKIAVGEIRLTPTELQTALFEVANLCNERPVRINKTVLGLMGLIKFSLQIAPINKVPDISQLSSHSKKTDRFELV